MDGEGGGEFGTDHMVFGENEGGTVVTNSGNGLTNGNHKNITEPNRGSGKFYYDTQQNSATPPPSLINWELLFFTEILKCKELFNIELLLS